jgi:phosphoribosyl-AMP cyclohydrolase
MSREFLDMDLTVDGNLVLKSSHHYLVKLCKNLTDVSMVGFSLKDSLSSLTSKTCLYYSRSRMC